MLRNVTESLERLLSLESLQDQELASKGALRPQYTILRVLVDSRTLLESTKAVQEVTVCGQPSGCHYLLIPRTLDTLLQPIS